MFFEVLGRIFLVGYGVTLLITVGMLFLVTIVEPIVGHTRYKNLMKKIEKKIRDLRL